MVAILHDWEKNSKFATRIFFWLVISAKNWDHRVSIQAGTSDKLRRGLPPRKATIVDNSLLLLFWSDNLSSLHDNRIFFVLTGWKCLCKPSLTGGATVRCLNGIHILIMQVNGFIKRCIACTFLEIRVLYIWFDHFTRLREKKERIFFCFYFLWTYHSYYVIYK